MPASTVVRPDAPRQAEPAPRLVGLDAAENPVEIADWWKDAPVVAIFLRHFG